MEQRVGSEQLDAKWPTSPQLKHAYDWQVFASCPGRWHFLQVLIWPL